MISARIEIEDKKGLLGRLFAAEEGELVNDRATTAVAHSEGKAIITVEARDAVALRAALNSACKALVVHEKTGKVIDDE